MLGLLAIDPGNTTGFAYFDSNGDVQNWGHLLGGVDGMVGFLQAFTEPVDTIVIEDYRVRGDIQGLKANVGSQLETVQIIGAIKGWAIISNCEVILQAPQLKRMGEKYSNLRPSGAHNNNSHKVDAYNHGYYWLVKNKLIAPAGLTGREMV
jgi:hypothetical protein